VRVRGFGFNETTTFINQNATGEGTNRFVALGVPKKTNNAGIYYDHHGVMVRLSQVYQQGSQSSGAGQNGITAAALFGRTDKQAGFSSSFDLDQLLARDGWPPVSFDVVNLNRAKREAYFPFPNAVFSSYDPART
jgi:hypothetical protein